MGSHEQALYRQRLTLTYWEQGLKTTPDRANRNKDRTPWAHKIKAANHPAPIGLSTTQVRGLLSFLLSSGPWSI